MRPFSRNSGLLDKFLRRSSYRFSWQSLERFSRWQYVTDGRMSSPCKVFRCPKWPPNDTDHFHVELKIKRESFISQWRRRPQHVALLNAGYRDRLWTGYQQYLVRKTGDRTHTQQFKLEAEARWISNQRPSVHTKRTSVTCGTRVAWDLPHFRTESIKKSMSALSYRSSGHHVFRKVRSKKSYWGGGCTVNSARP